MLQQSGFKETELAEFTAPLPHRAAIIPHCILQKGTQYSMSPGQGTPAAQSWAVRQVMRLVWRRQPSGKDRAPWWGTAAGAVIAPLWLWLSGLQRDLASFRERGYEASSGMGNEVRILAKGKVIMLRIFSTQGLWAFGDRLFLAAATHYLKGHKTEALNSFPGHHSLPSSACAVTTNVI